MMEGKHSDIIEATAPVIKAFEQLAIPYYIAGSVASSAYGIARSTMDIDMVSSLSPDKVKSFVRLLRNDYYIDEQMILAAIRNKSSFNIIHLETMLKIDVFIAKSSLYEQKALERRTKDTIEEGAENLEVYLASPEDVILNKLDWYRLGGEVSESQLNDVLGIVKVQKKALDFKYLNHWAKELGLQDLLEKILAK